MLLAGARHELTSVNPGYESRTLRRTFEPQQHKDRVSITDRMRSAAPAQTARRGRAVCAGKRTNETLA
jgi:hypothetical protein